MSKPVMAVLFVAACGRLAAQPAVEAPELVAPNVASPPAVVAAMLTLAGVKDGDVVLDLGCGDGRIPLAAVRDFKARWGLGLDSSPDRIAEAVAAGKKAGPAIEKKLAFRRGDVLKLAENDFRTVDVVALYLLPEINERLGPVLQKGLKPGSRVVSHEFDMGKEWKPEKTTTVMVGEVEHVIHLWTVAAPK